MNANKKKEHAPGPLRSDGGGGAMSEKKTGSMKTEKMPEELRVECRSIGWIVAADGTSFAHALPREGCDWRGAQSTNAAELVRRWNAHEELVKACELALRGLTQGLLPDDPAVLATLRVAIARSAPPGLSERCGAYPPSPGEWRCLCVPKDPAYDTSVNPPFVSACTSCGARRP